MADALERRTFLKSGLALGAGAVGFSSLALETKPSAAAALEDTPAKPGPLPTRPFGSTGHTLPILGFGGSAMIKLWHELYGVELLSTEDRVAMVRYAFDSGVRYFDTARVYGESESIIGAGLKGVRDQCYVATKCHMTDPAQVRKCVETSLEQLQMDHVDCVQVHSPAIERVGFETAMKLHAELVKLRDEKLTRFIGLTTHVAFETIHQMIAAGGFDQVLLAYGYFRKGMDTILSNRNLEFRELCLAAAHERKMAIVAMKVMGANILSHFAPQLVPEFAADARAKLPSAAIRWTLRDERVSMLNIGVSMKSDVDENLRTLQGDHRLTSEDQRLLAEFSVKAYEAPIVKAMALT